MKFVVSSVAKCAPRLGVLKEMERFPNLSLQTPMAMLYTRGGSIPHITNEVFKLVSKELQVIQIPLVSTYNFEDAMTDFAGNIAEFVGMKECISCVTVQDPGDYTQPGHHFQDCIPIWTRQGKVLINAKLYMNSVEVYKPDMYYLLSDGDTNIASSAKRINKAVNNTVTYFKQCIERHEQSEILKKSFVMGAIAGGYSLKARQECINAVCGNNAICGYLIDGLHNNGPEVEFQSGEEIKEVIEFVINKLPQEKLRAVHGCWNPVTVLQLVQLGVDLFDTSYCHIVTERSCALTFALHSNSKDNPYEINLRQSEFAEDFGPIVEKCTCLACTKYSRGYIYHLVTAQELLGPLLLTIHNVHHYMRFFEKIRTCIQEGTLDVLQARIAQQFNAHQNAMAKLQKDESNSKIEQSDAREDATEIPTSKTARAVLAAEGNTSREDEANEIMEDETTQANSTQFALLEKTPNEVSITSSS